VAVANLIGSTISDRYQLTEELGHGGMGTVYRAADTRLQRDVALKILSNTRIGTEGRARMLREAQVVARLSHPNIVTVFDAGEHDETPYIVMELVQGKTLAEQPPKDQAEAVALTLEICAALSHAHGQGIVHRDLKPENVIRQQGGPLKLMDFGLARSVSSRMTQEGTVIGTVFYMAPEQAMGDDTTPVSDLYSLGVMLYEMLTGSLPFEASDPIAVITQHIHAPVPPPRARREDIPFYLDELVVRLLSKEPASRPQSAAEVVAALEARAEAAAPTREEVSELERIVRGRIIGREEELREARQLWGRVAEGQGQLLLISGEPGVGKTRFTREIVTHAEVSGALVLQGASYAEGGMPYSAFRAVLRRALRSTAAKAMDIPPDILKDLLTLAPELRSSFPNIKDLDTGELPDPQRLIENFVVFINMLGQKGPVLLVLEDVHWADSGSLALLRHLARSTRESRVMTLVNYREVEIHENRAFHDILLDFNRERLGQRVKLGRLDREQTRTMLGEMFREEITDEFLDGIFGETEGHPFFIEEVCKALVESGKLYFKDGSWHRPSIQELGIPQSVQVTIQARLDQLPAEAQDLLRQAAILGREFDFHILQRAAGLDELELIDVLEQAEKAQLVEEVKEQGEGALFAFVHALIPTTLVEDTRTIRRRVMHRRAGEALEALDAANLPALAYHFTEAGEAEKATRYLLEVADRAAQLHSLQEAANAYSQALDHLREASEEERTYRTLLKLALVYQKSLDFEASNRAYDEAFQLQKRIGSQRADQTLAPAPHPFRFSVNAPGDLDPVMYVETNTAFIVRQMFLGLVDAAPEGTIHPAMAERWEILEGGQKAVFHLRRDARWSDGQPVTADDFEFTFKRTLTPETAAPLASLLYPIKNAEAFHTGRLKDADAVGIRAADATTLEITLERPTGYLLPLLAGGGCYATPRHVVEKHGSEWTRPENIVCNGAFVLVEYEPGSHLRMRRNPLSVAVRRGNVEEFLFVIHSDYDTAYEDYQEDKIDMIILNGLPTEKVEHARRRYPDEILTVGTINVGTLIIYPTQPALADVRVRQALSLAIDRDYLCGKVWEGLAIPATGGLVPPGLAGHSPGIGLGYDPLRARRLMAEAGYPNGEGMLPLKSIGAEIGWQPRLQEYLVEQWGEVLGVQLEFEQMPYVEALRAFGRAFDAGKPYPVGVGGWNADYPDPHNYLWDYVRWSLPDWKNERYEALMAQAMDTQVQAERLRLYQQADKIVIEECYVIPVVHGISQLLTKPWIKSEFARLYVTSPLFDDVILVEH
jgi:ABC-type oligopeptide transport system substrate-binding subunit